MVKCLGRSEPPSCPASPRGQHGQEVKTDDFLALRNANVALRRMPTVHIIDEVGLQKFSLGMGGRSPDGHIQDRQPRGPTCERFSAQIATEGQLHNCVKSHTAATRKQAIVLVDTWVRASCVLLHQVPSVAVVILVFEPNADMIGQLDDWSFKTRIVIHDASPPIVAKRNRHAGKLTVASATVEGLRRGRFETINCAA